MKQTIGLLIRHGETALNEKGCFRGWVDVELDEKGEEEARLVALFLAANYKVKRIFTSPLCRAYATATLFAEMVDLEVTQDRGLLPWHVGMFSGQPRDENMDALQLFVQNPEVAIPGGQSLQDFEARAFDFFHRELEEAKEKGLTAFFAHTSNVTVLENLIIGQRSGGPESGETVKPGGVCAIHFENGRYEVEPVFGKPEPANYGS